MGELPSEVDDVTQGTYLRQFVGSLSEDADGTVAELEPVDGLVHVEGAVDDLQPLDVMPFLLVIVVAGGINNNAHRARLRHFRIVVEQLVQGLQPFLLLFCH